MESSTRPEEQHKLSLTPTTSASGYLYPSIWSWPPFFTQQPNEQTYTHQAGLWTRLILTHAKFHRTFRLDLTEAQLDSEPFSNKAINRRMPLPFLKAVVSGMVAEGSAEYDPPVRGKSPPIGVLIYWKRPEEWATTIYNWIKESGLTGSIMTLYELVEGGDLVDKQEFYLLPDPILRKALDILAKQGKAQVFTSTGEEGDGVKFV